MALEDCHDLLVLVLLRGGKRREAHLVHLRHRRAPGEQVLQDLEDLYAESGQTLQGSFSAVSKPNFAMKY